MNSSLPGILKTDDNPSGILDPNALIIENPINITSIISMIVLLWSAASLMTALRIAILGMFGITYLSRPFIKAKLLDLSGFLMIGVGGLATVTLVTLSSQFSEVILDWLGIPGEVGSFLISVGTLLIALVVDTLIFMFLFSIMAGAHPPLKDLVKGALLAGVASSVLRFLGTTAVSSVSGNPLLAPFAAIATLLIWVNLLAQVTLVAAAFVANPPAPGQPTKSQLEHADEYPNYVTETVQETLEWNFDPMTGVVAPHPDRDNETELVPPWSGIRAAWMKSRISRAETNLDKARQQLDEVRKDYADAAWDAYEKKTVPTTSSLRAQADPRVTGEKLARELQQQSDNEA